MDYAHWADEFAKKKATVLARYDAIKDEVIPITQEWINREAASAARLMTENRELRERITALEIENARLMGELVAATRSSDIAHQYIYNTCEAPAEPLPQSESDRIFWDALRMAAQT